MKINCKHIKHIHDIDNLKYAECYRVEIVITISDLYCDSCKCFEEKLSKKQKHENKQKRSA